MLEKIWRAIRHNQGLAVAVVICIGLGMWTFGCESKVKSLKNPTVMVTRPELKIEIDEAIGTAEMRMADLDRQDEIKKKLIEFALASAESGGIDKTGLIGLAGWVLGLGAVVDNRRKDGVIKGKKK